MNNDSFRPNFKDLALASYRFTVLRCPYGRLVSCYLDKIVKRTEDAQRFIKASQFPDDLGTLTFRRFCMEIARPDVRNTNLHWRPQIDFLVYANYDAYFCFENFAAIAPTLKSRIGLELVDARPMARHDSSQYQVVDGTSSFANVSLTELEAMLKGGSYPKPQNFYDCDLKQLVEATYEADFALYRRECPGRGLFADQALATAAV
jgi:hypothetical protein